MCLTGSERFLRRDLSRRGFGITELDAAIEELAALRREIVEIKAESRRCSV